MNRVSVKGILIGAIIDIVATNILLIPLIIYIVAKSDLSGVAEADIQDAIMKIMNNDFIIHSIHLGIGISCSVLGGYVGARIAKHDELLNGALTSFLCVGFGVYSLYIGSSGIPLLEHIVLLLVTPALAMFGGYLRLNSRLDNGRNA